MNICAVISVVCIFMLPSRVQVQAQECGETCCAFFYRENGTCKECDIGYYRLRFDSDSYCKPCRMGFFGQRCHKTCYCSDLERCDNVAGCVCRNVDEMCRTQFFPDVQTGSRLTGSTDGFTTENILNTTESIIQTNNYGHDGNDGFTKENILKTTETIVQTDIYGHNGNGTEDIHGHLVGVPYAIVVLLLIILAVILTKKYKASCSVTSRFNMHEIQDINTISNNDELYAEIDENEIDESVRVTAKSNSKVNLHGEDLPSLCNCGCRGDGYLAMYSSITTEGQENTPAANDIKHMKLEDICGGYLTPYQPLRNDLDKYTTVYKVGDEDEQQTKTEENEGQIEEHIDVNDDIVVVVHEDVNDDVVMVVHDDENDYVVMVEHDEHIDVSQRST